VEALITFLLIAALFALLGSGVWIGLALSGVAWIGMELFSSRPAGDAMAVTIWGSASSWTLTALPLFVWMGEILFRTRLSEDMFRGLAPWLERLPGRLLHTNVIGCTIFAAVSGSSAATCATIGKMTLPELRSRGYPDGITVGSLAGAGTLGLLIPPSIIMIVYGVAANVSIATPGKPSLTEAITLAARSGRMAATSRRYPVKRTVFSRPRAFARAAHAARRGPSPTIRKRASGRARATTAAASMNSSWPLPSARRAIMPTSGAAPGTPSSARSAAARAASIGAASCRASSASNVASTRRRTARM